MFFALGGPDNLKKAADDLETIRSRRMYKKKSIMDPVVASIVRTQAISASRSNIRFANGRHTEKAADLDTAAKLWKQLEPSAKFFDSQTLLQASAQSKRIQYATGSKKTT
jgi:hypothetical protein